MAGTGGVIDDVFSEVFECGRESTSSADTSRNVRRSSRIRDRSRSQRPGCLVSQDKGMFAGVVGNAKQKHFARESIVDLATRTLERKPTLWVIASGATATKC